MQSPGMILARFLLAELSAPSSARPTPPPELALEPTSPRPEEDCPICLAPLEEACSRTPCNHVFHQKCLETYFIASRGDAGSPGARGKCPICRGPIHAPLPVEARAMSGRPIDVISQIGPGAKCHFDRHYGIILPLSLTSPHSKPNLNPNLNPDPSSLTPIPTPTPNPNPNPRSRTLTPTLTLTLTLAAFRSLGGFEQPGMLYVITSNEDRKVHSRRCSPSVRCRGCGCWCWWCGGKGHSGYGRAPHL